MVADALTCEPAAPVVPRVGNAGFALDPRVKK